jgi:hypothetical protein
MGLNLVDVSSPHRMCGVRLWTGVLANALGEGKNLIWAEVGGAEVGSPIRVQ